MFMMAIMVYGGCTICNFITKDVPLSSTGFTFACLALSSTPLVVKFLQSSTDREVSADSECGSLLLGMLVTQDVQLGLIIALLPAFAKSAITDDNSGLWSTIASLIEVSMSLILVSIVTLIIARYLIGNFMKILHSSPLEVQILGGTAFMFGMLLFTHTVGMSMELGCFSAGIVISTHASSYKERLEHQLEPLKDLFSTFFFTTIGFHVFPSFVAYAYFFQIYENPSFFT